MKLAVLTYYNRNYVVDTSFVSSAEILRSMSSMSLNFAGYKSSNIYSLKTKENVIQ